MTKTYRFYCIAVLIVALAVLGQATRQRKVHQLPKLSQPNEGNVNVAADQQKEIKVEQEQTKKETQKLDKDYENHQKREQNIKAKEEEIKAKEEEIKAKEKEIKNIIIQNLNFKAKQIEMKKKLLNLEEQQVQMQLHNLTAGISNMDHAIDVMKTDARGNKANSNKGGGKAKPDEGKPMAEEMAKFEQKFLATFKELQEEMELLMNQDVSKHNSPEKRICEDALKSEAFYSIFGPHGTRFYTGKGYKGKVDVMKHFSEKVLRSCRLSEPANMNAQLKIFDHPVSIQFDFATGTFSNFNCQKEISHSTAIDAKFSSELCKRLVTSKGSAKNSKAGENFAIACEEGGKSVSIRFHFDHERHMYRKPEILYLTKKENVSFYETPEVVSLYSAPKYVPNTCHCDGNSVQAACFGPSDKYAVYENVNDKENKGKENTRPSCRTKQKGDTCPRSINSGGNHQRRRLLASRSMISASRARRGSC